MYNGLSRFNEHKCDVTLCNFLSILRFNLELFGAKFKMSVVKNIEGIYKGTVRESISTITS